MPTSVVKLFISEDFERVRLYEDERSPPPHAYVVSVVEKTEENKEVDKNDLCMPSPTEFLSL